MKALKWHGARDLRLAQVAPRALAETGEIRVQVAYCGICGSDMHEYLDGPHSIPVEQPHPLSGRVAPLIIGHEFCGVVTEISPDVKTLRVGDRVVIEPEYRCGTCFYCRAGRYNQCVAMGFVGLMGDGGMAEEAVIPAYMAHVLPSSVSFEHAAVTEPAAVALHAVRQSSLRPGDDCVVFGLGTIGLLIIMMAAQHGARHIIGVDVEPSRLKLALEVGATEVLDSRQSDVPSRVRELTDGLGVPVSFEAAGHPATINGALHVLRKGGEMVLVGLMSQATLDIFDIVNRELRITASVGYRDVYPDLLALMASGKVDLMRIVTSIVGLDDAVRDGFEALATNRNEIKVLVRP